MTSISASTKLKVAVPAAPAPKKAPAPAPKAPALGIGKAKKPTAPAAKKGGAADRRGSVAPAVKAGSLVTPQAIDALKSLDKESQKNRVTDLLRNALGEQSLVDKSTPHAASTTRDRAGAAGDVAICARELGIPFVLRQCGVMDAMQRMLFPEGIESVFKSHIDGDENGGKSTGLKPSTSAISLSSMDDGSVVSGGSTGGASASNLTMGTDSKRGKTTPPNAREGSLLLIRALCETVGKGVEPFVVGAFLAAALDECGSSSSFVREAAEDTAAALVSLANPWAFPCLIAPLLLQAMGSSEWRVKSIALERLAQCAKTAPTQVSRLIPTLIPALTEQLWDTKVQVTKAAGAALLDVCRTNTNMDIAPAIPAVVNAICKPSDTMKAIEQLMGTTFVVPVDASSLAMLCPVLARALKEKLAIHKRGACIVIANMSKLVSAPADVAPFGPLLVPELQKVATNVQFEDIRDEALKALASLTKALGDLYELEEAKSNKLKEMEEETARVEEANR